MRNRILILGAALLCATAAIAQPVPLPTNLPDNVKTNLPNFDPSTNLFDIHQVSIEMGPVYRGTTPDSFEASAAASYYFGRAASLDWGGRGEVITGDQDNIAHSLMAELLVRKPIGNFAVYGMFGGGRDLSAGKWCGDFGGGVEYAFTRNYATGSNWRYIFEQGDSKNTGILGVVYVSRRF